LRSGPSAFPAGSDRAEASASAVRDPEEKLGTPQAWIITAATTGGPRWTAVRRRGRGPRPAHREGPSRRWDGYGWRACCSIHRLLHAGLRHRSPEQCDMSFVS
jgi:hypothetical protein